MLKKRSVASESSDEYQSGIMGCRIGDIIIGNGRAVPVLQKGRMSEKLRTPVP